MMRLALFAIPLVSFLASTAAADPAYYRVTGVAADDTLNVRAAPDGDSADIGDLAHDQTGIEVIDVDESGAWGRIGWEEAQGWVAMRFLEADEIATLGDTPLPAGLLCGGTEPFWSVRYTEGSGVYSDFDFSAIVLAEESLAVAAGRQSFPVLLRHTGNSARTTAIVRPNLCSDGMSDRDYPYSIALLIELGTEGAFFEGCCRLPLDAGSY